MPEACLSSLCFDLVLSLRLADVWLRSLPALLLRCCSLLPVAISPGCWPRLLVAWLSPPVLVPFGLRDIGYLRPIFLIPGLLGSDP